MTKRMFSSAARKADQILFALHDRLSGNRARRHALRVKLFVAMTHNEHHGLIRARVVSQHRHPCHGNNMLHYRHQYHLSSV